MKELVALLALAALAAAPTMALAKKKKRHHVKPHAIEAREMTFDEAMAYNQRNLSLIVQGLPLVLPSWSLPIYFKMQEHADEEKDGKRRKH